jgi:folate-binding protein YgfZ
MNLQDDPAFLAQYEAATTGAGRISLAGWSTLRVAGRDRATFLHNMCTNDVKGLTPGGQCEAFFTDVKGKIVGHANIFARPDELLLVGVPGQAARLAAHLDRYIIREDVQLADISADLEWALLIGPHAKQVGDLGSSDALLKTAVSFEPCVQIWAGGFWVGMRTQDRAKPQAAGDAVWEALRVESGWPLFGVDFDDSNLPQEVGRDARAISFRKGCYLGQETVARIDALGHVNKRLATLRLSQEAAVGEELFDGEGKPAGTLTSVAWSPKMDAWLALAMVRRGVNEPGASLVCRGHAATVIETPAVARSPRFEEPGAK